MQVILRYLRVYKKGDIVAINPDNDSQTKSAIVVQADWFNMGQPPSYIVSLISTDVFPELDFRPVIKPDNKNGLSTISQAAIDKTQIIKSSQIIQKTGEVNKQLMKDINGCLRAILGL